MMAVTPSELTEFNLKHHIAPVVPMLMAITGVVNAAAWFISLAVGNPNPGYLAAVQFLGGFVLVLLGAACHRTASAGHAQATTVVSVAFVFVTATLLSLVAINNNTGLLQSLPYCMVLTAVSGFFWPSRWGLVVGSIAGMAPPVAVVVTGHSALSMTPRFFVIYAQLWMSALAVSFFLFLFMNRVRRRYLVVLRDLEEQSRRDTLTGLFNRRHLYDQVAARQADALRRVPRRGGLLLYMDVDHFKAVNDRLGHAEGDRVLQHAAQAVRAACEPTDLIARFGGEEFVVCRMGVVSAEEGFATLTTRLQEALRQPHPGLVHPGEPVTMSAGGTVLLPGEPVDTALLRADAALFQAKRAGRNRSVFLPAPAVGDDFGLPGREPAGAQSAMVPRVIPA
ncbi:MAG: GGDEF domain-containing protein [Thermomicrobiales bacterium]